MWLPSKSLLLRAVLPLLLSGLQAARAAAQEVDEAGWAFTAVPYVWFTSVEGDVATIRGIPPAEVDARFGDILDNADFAFMGYFEGRRDRWGFSADLLYMDISADGNGPIPAFSKTEMDFKAFTGTFGPFYRAVQEESFTLDVMAGARLWVTDTELTLKSNTGPGQSNDEKETWADPIIGMRAAFAATDSVSVKGLADVGGFGAASDITYQLMAAVSYAFTPSISADLGYRYLKVDYEDDGFVLNTAFQGPIVGMVIRF